MRGYPSTLNTKHDYYYVKEHFPKEQWQPDWQALLDTMQDYFFVRHLEAEEPVPVGEHIKIVDPSKDDELRSVYELKLNPMCKLLRLGFSEEEVKAALK